MDRDWENKNSYPNTKFICFFKYNLFIFLDNHKAKGKLVKRAMNHIVSQILMRKRNNQQFKGIKH